MTAVKGRWMKLGWRWGILHNSDDDAASPPARLLNFKERRRSRRMRGMRNGKNGRFFWQDNLSPASATAAASRKRGDNSNQTRAHILLNVRVFTLPHRLEMFDRRWIIEKITPQKCQDILRLILAVHVVADLLKLHPSIHPIGSKSCQTSRNFLG